jgi:hypothetical protein
VSTAGLHTARALQLPADRAQQGPQGAGGNLARADADQLLVAASGAEQATERWFGGGCPSGRLRCNRWIPMEQLSHLSAAHPREALLLKLQGNGEGHQLGLLRPQAQRNGVPGERSHR